jgi:hypothetical protein
VGVAGIQQVDGDNLPVGASGNPVGGAGLAVTSSQGNLFFDDLDVYAATGTALAASGTGTGLTFTVTPAAPDGVGTSTIDADNGPALDISSATIDLRLALVESTTTAAGLNLAGIGGQFRAPAGSSITKTAGAGTAFTVANSVSGTTVAYAGTLNVTSGAGVSLSSNTGSTISFTNTLTLSTGANAAFAASGGGTVTVTGATNTLTTTTVTALTVTNTTIGSSHLTFKSISASGAASGIVLTNTGSTGHLAVTGDGNSSVGGNGSGGTIQNTSGPGISLTSTTGPTFTNLTIRSTTRSGISGAGVTNFSFINGAISNSAVTSAGTVVGQVDDANIALSGSNGLGNNIAGTLVVTGSTLTNAYYHGIYIAASDGTVTDANLSNNTITSSTNQASSKGSGILFNGTGVAGTVSNLNKATISGNAVSNFPSGSGIFVATGNAGASGPGGTGGIPGDATNVISITNNNVHGEQPASLTNSMASFGIAVVGTNGNAASRGRFHFNIANNGSAADPIRNMLGQGIQIGNNGYTDMVGTITNNVIQPHNINASQGIGGGNGVAGAGNAWTPHLTLTVTKNAISHTDGSGILLVGRSTSGRMDLRVDNNTVATPDSTTTIARRTVQIEAGNSLSNDDAICLAMSGNTVGLGLNGALGIGVRKQGNVATVNDFGIQGISQASPTNAQVQTFLQAQNPNGNGVDVLQGPGYTQCNTAP